MEQIKIVGKNVTIISPETEISNGKQLHNNVVMSCMNICFFTCNEIKGDDIKQISYIQVLIHKQAAVCL